jgi:hypothetical protein
VFLFFFVAFFHRLATIPFRSPSKKMRFPLRLFSTFAIASSIGRQHKQLQQQQQQTQRGVEKKDVMDRKRSLYYYILNV